MHWLFQKVLCKSIENGVCVCVWLVESALLHFPYRNPYNHYYYYSYYCYSYWRYSMTDLVSTQLLYSWMIHIQWSVNYLSLFHFHIKILSICFTHLQRSISMNDDCYWWQVDIDPLHFITALMDWYVAIQYIYILWLVRACIVFIPGKAIV